MRAARAHTVLAVALVALATTTPGADAAQRAAPPQFRTIPLRTVPAVAGIRITVAGRTAVTDRRGRARILVPTRTTRVDDVTGGGLQSLLRTIKRSAPRVEGVPLPERGRAAFDRFQGGDVVTVALDTFYMFHPSFIGIDGRRIDARAVQSYTLKSRHGVRVTVKGAQPVELQGSRVVSLNDRLVSKKIGWAVERVIVGGGNAVHRGQQRFHPARLDAAFPIQLLFFRARFTSQDAIFGFHVGSAVKLRYPDGTEREYPFGPDGTVTLPALPRGDYSVDVEGPGLTPARPVALSRDQVVDLKVISFLDLAVVGFGFATVLIGLAVARRPHLRSPARVRMHVAGLAAARRQAAARRAHGAEAAATHAHRSTAELDHSIAPQPAHEQVAETQ
jgi:hypothetical protein